jgi:hypothetical protein
VLAALRIVSPTSSEFASKYTLKTTASVIASVCDVWFASAVAHRESIMALFPAKSAAVQIYSSSFGLFSFSSVANAYS